MDMTGRVNDIVLNALLEKEKEVDEKISQYSALERKIEQSSDVDLLQDIRNKRLEKLKGLHQQRNDYLQRGYGRVAEINSDKDFFDACREAETVASLPKSTFN
ncbi:hypothetical protein BdWA1_001140 [Babesia duncani]|uniref:Uncharacterized protein n=1 Tax=Babesia duncani TaxID=323732 RepID=A0AAD9PNV6_9APIC|nr:hypothetical protein BdWA1_003581 [Babesia duncani]KAK2198135.1 hypothetical protein BdWA1_001140 [Babesia duncani]